jgi:acetyl-CoA acetyltransferase
MRGRTAIAGVGESTYYKHGAAPVTEFELCLDAVLAACADAGIDPRQIDGFSSYGNDRNDAGRLACALGITELRCALMVWGGGGGGVCAAVANAAAAVAAGTAEYVVVTRALAQGSFGRFGLRGTSDPTVTGAPALYAPYGLVSPAQMFAMRGRRYMHEHGIDPASLRAISMASYHHAQSNPRAVMHGRPLSEEQYEAARWIVEPLRLYDCCMENDGAAAVVVCSAEQARDLRQPPAYVVAAAQGGGPRHGEWVVHNDIDYASSNFKELGRRLWQMAGVGPGDVDVLQVYENFTPGVLMALTDFGFVDPGEVDEVVTFENLIAPSGRLPLNTSGGNLAECYVHGLQLVVEAARQIRGTAVCQVADAEYSFVAGGPMVSPASGLLLGKTSA